jgi:acetyl esterase/lipase
MKKIYLIFIMIFAIGLNLFAQQIIPLYPDSIPNSHGNLSKTDTPTLTVYLPMKEKATGTAVIIFPGGSYSSLAILPEGILAAKAFVQKGITAFVVKYRLPKDATMPNKSMGPLMDAQQAIKVVRGRAKEWNLDVGKIGIIGYSAGGHLASTLSTHYSISYIPNIEKINLRPNFMILMYPVISMSNGLTHPRSRKNLLGSNPSKEKVIFFSSEENITQNTPPTYITHAGNDDIVDVENSIVMYRWLQMEGVPSELHIFPNGGHGFTQALSIDEWQNPIISFLRRQGFLDRN